MLQNIQKSGIVNANRIIFTVAKIWKVLLGFSSLNRPRSSRIVHFCDQFTIATMISSSMRKLKSSAAFRDAAVNKDIQLRAASSDVLMEFA